MKRMKKLLSLFLVFALVLGLCALSALAAGRLTVASLEADKTAAAVGDTVTWTASASGGVGALRYAFYVYRGGERIYQGRYGTQPSFSYTPDAPGPYCVKVFVKDGSGSCAALLGGEVSVPASRALAVASVTADKDTAAVGEAITWTASLAGGGLPLRCAFYVYRGGQRIYQGGYGTDASFTYTPDAPGPYSVKVFVKDGFGSYAALTGGTVAVSPEAPLSLVSLTADKDTAAVGEAITWTASFSGGGLPLRCAFNVYRSGQRIYQGGYGTGTDFTYTPDAPGLYTVKAYVKDGFGSYAVLAGGAVTVSPEAPLTVASVEADKTACVPGSPVTWTASFTGGCQPQSYAFYVLRDGEILYRGSYGTSTTFTYKPEDEGSYTVIAFARDSLTAVSLMSGPVTAAYQAATVAYHANGGKGTMEEQSGKAGVATALTPNAFTLGGHAFTGWNTKADGSGVSYGDGATVTLPEQLVLYAQWAAVEKDWSWEEVDGGVSVTGYAGPDTDLAIPAKLGGKPVVAIGDGAFIGRTDRTSISFPDTVKRIGNSAFERCQGLTGSLTLPQGVTSIGDYAFCGCTGLTGSLTIPQGVTSIGNDVFEYCYGFNGSLNLPSTLTSIGDLAFRGCSGFTGSLTIPASLTSIGSGAFSDCSGFTGTLTLPASLTSIGSGAFYGCSGFTGSLTIPQGVTTIGTNTFCSCKGFNGSLTLPASLTSIGSEAFQYCSGFTGMLTIPQGVTTIGSEAFFGCFGFTGSLTLPQGVTTIGYSAFRGCSGFTGSLTLPEGVTSIGSCAFEVCSGFTGSLTLPEGVTNIGEYAFWGCSGFTGSLTIPEGVTNIGEYAFVNTGFTTVKLPLSLTSVNAFAFDECDALAQVWYEGGEADWEQIAIGDHNEPLKNAQRIYHCSAEGWIFTLSGSEAAVTGYIGPDSALAIPASLGGKPVVSIGKEAFMDRTDLTAVSFPDTLKSIGDGAFFGCTGLTGSLTLPGTLTSIGGFAFSDCSGFTGSLTIPEGVTAIGDSAFCDCCGFTGSLTIPEGVTTIGDYAFSGCYGFTGSLTLPELLTSIGESAFQDCYGFTGSLTIPEGVTTIGDYAFQGCYGFGGTLTLSSGVQTVGKATFNCTYFKAVRISLALQTVGENAFLSCDDLKTVFYAGSERDWGHISFADGNECLTGANIAFDYSG